MEYSSKRFSSFIISAVLFIFSFILFLILVVPTYQSSQELRGKKIVRDEFLEEQKQVVAQVKGLISSFEGDISLSEVISMALPSAREESVVLRHVSTLAGLNRLQLGSIDFERPRIQSGSSGERANTSFSIRPVGVVKIRAQLSGPYEQFEEFLRNIETNIRIFDIETLDINSRNTEAGDSFSYNISLKAYFQE